MVKQGWWRKGKENEERKRGVGGVGGNISEKGKGVGTREKQNGD